MSEVQKPVEETPVVLPTTEESTVPSIEPVAETKAGEPVAETATEPTAETTTGETPAVAEEAAAELTPTEEGALGYKAPGLIKSFRFAKTFFWFGSEPVETKNLTSYLRGEKAEIANHNAAWSSQTGKGLLYFSKHATEKANPAGIINLADISDLSKEGPVEFLFHYHGQKHAFKAGTAAERDGWFSAIETKSAEAKESKESITGSDGYKDSHSALSKPAAAAVAPIAAAPKKSTDATKEPEKEVKKEEKAEAKVEKAEAKKETAETKEKERKARSQSRGKRASIFGSLLNKKDEHEQKKADKVIAKEEPNVEAAKVEETAPAPADVATEPVAETKVEEPVAETAAATTEAPTAEEPVTTPTERPAASKRNSIFGNFFPKKGKSETEAAPVVPAKDAAVTEPTVTSDAAPVLPEPETTEPLATSVASPATVPTETTTIAEPTTNGATETEKPTMKSEKRKSSLPFSFGTKKEKSATSDSEGEKPLSPFAKLRQTVKKASSPKTEKPAEPTTETPAATEAPATTEAPAETSEANPAVSEPVVSEPIPAAHTSTPQVSATA